MKRIFYSPMYNDNNKTENILTNTPIKKIIYAITIILSILYIAGIHLPKILEIYIFAVGAILGIIMVGYFIIAAATFLLISVGIIKS